MLRTTLSHRIWPVAADANLTRNMTLAIIGSLVVALAAQVSVPMWPVPMTLQTLAVLAIGAAYGAKLGALTILIYALEGALGLPFFAGGQAGLYQPDGTLISSGGYVFGFVLAAFVTGWLAERDWGKSMIGLVLAALAGAVVLHIPGLLWLAAWAVLAKAVPQSEAIAVALAWGFTPFFVGDVVKAILAGFGVGSFAIAQSRTQADSMS
jgi:biotin transport system substrate-specific component